MLTVGIIGYLCGSLLHVDAVDDIRWAAKESISLTRQTGYTKHSLQFGRVGSFGFSVCTRAYVYVYICACACVRVVFFVCVLKEREEKLRRKFQENG